ncbi:MAG TPA: hypothetical protein VFL79_02465 [Terriglobia bacterium]|nr:hypothetical protein [Terriglobia bacterium]
MRKKYSVVIVTTIILFGVAVPSAWAKKKKAQSVSPDDPTYKVFQLLDDSYGGKLSDYYLLADLYVDPQNPSNQLQHVIRVDYDKSRFFGRFRVYVRSVGKLTPDQMGTYDLKQIYDFGESDDTEFEKINPGPLGETGDLYMQATADGPLAPAPITDEARQEYDTLITKYILPALQKK